MPEGRNHAEAIPRIVEKTAEHVVNQRPVASMAEVVNVGEDDRRVTIELLSDDGAKANNVPVAVPFADGESGDVLPIEPGLKGIVLFLDHSVEEELSTGGTGDGSDGMALEDAVFLPAFFTTNEESIPKHVSGDRVWEHPSGSRIEMGHSGSIEITHENGGTIEIGGETEPETVDDPRMHESFHESSVHPADAIAGTEADHHGHDAYTDNETWPVGDVGDTYDRLQHPDGPHVTVTHRGVSLGPDTDREATEVVSGQQNDPERSELDGHHQHFHIVDHGHGEFSLAGPQLNFREFIAWMTDDERQDSLRNSEQHADARRYAKNYLKWLEEQVGRELDPTDPESWPETEPMPTPEQREYFERSSVVAPSGTATAGATGTADGQWGWPQRHVTTETVVTASAIGTAEPSTVTPAQADGEATAVGEATPMVETVAAAHAIAEANATGSAIVTVPAEATATAGATGEATATPLVYVEATATAGASGTAEPTVESPAEATATATASGTAGPGRFETVPQPVTVTGAGEGSATATVEVLPEATATAGATGEAVVARGFGVEPFGTSEFGSPTGDDEQ